MTSFETELNRIIENLKSMNTFSSWLETAKETDVKKITNKAAETKKGIGNKKRRDTEDRVRT